MKVLAWLVGRFGIWKTVLVAPIILFVFFLMIRVGIFGVSYQNISKSYLPFISIPYIDSIPSVLMSFGTIQDGKRENGVIGKSYSRSAGIWLDVDITEPGWLLVFSIDSTTTYPVFGGSQGAEEAKFIANVSDFPLINFSLDGRSKLERFYAVVSSKKFSVKDILPYIDQYKVSPSGLKGVDRRFLLKESDWFDSASVYFLVN